MRENSIFTDSGANQDAGAAAAGDRGTGVKRKEQGSPSPRTRRMDHAGRLQSARSWLATQRGRPAERIARSYRKRYGVDWPCAFEELATLGIKFDPAWRAQLARTLVGGRRARARRKAQQHRGTRCAGRPESDKTFAFIAGYTEGGAAYGITREEWTRMDRREKATPPAKVDRKVQPDDDQVPF